MQFQSDSDLQFDNYATKSQIMQSSYSDKKSNNAQITT